MASYFFLCLLRYPSRSHFFALHPVVIGKEYLQSIEFLPLSPGGLKCLFVIRLFTEQVRKLNLCLVGKIDAANGSIEAIGVEETPEVKLLLFCAAIAYRDVLVTRDVACQLDDAQGKSKPTKLKVKDRHLPLRLVARVKHNCSGIGERFAEPQLLASTLAQFSPYIRSCHLRKLQAGYSASETQIELAASYQFLVPPGYTFVRPTVVGSDLLADLRQEFRSISLLNLLFAV